MYTAEGSATQNASDRTSKSWSPSRVTLRVHPLFDQPIEISRSYGPDAVWASTSDGRLTILPVAWTDRVPKLDVPTVCGKEVRLAPDSLAQLARWVAAKIIGATDRRCKRLDSEIAGELPLNGDGADGREASLGKAERATRDGRTNDGGGGAGPAAVVEQAGAPGARRRSDRARRNGGG